MYQYPIQSWLFIRFSNYFLNIIYKINSQLAGNSPSIVWFPPYSPISNPELVVYSAQARYLFLKRLISNFKLAWNSLSNIRFVHVHQCPIQSWMFIPYQLDIHLLESLIEFQASLEFAIICLFALSIFINTQSRAGRLFVSLT
jgi:hypothetical protein